MITIFTPTYNRACMLPSLYKSLQAQTLFAFEWLIVDDGSTDNTPQLIKKWINEKNRFEIHYYRTTNGGKHRAINWGVQKAKYPAFFLVDSDDVLPTYAVERVFFYFKQIEQDSKFAGVYGLKSLKNTRKPLGNTYLLKVITDCSFLHLRWKYRIWGDMAEVYKTDILRQFPFPEFEGENFVSEGIVWRQISKHYLLRFVPEIWYFCDYLSDGLTKNIRRKYRQNPQGTIYLLNTGLQDGNYPLNKKPRLATLYWRYLCMQKIGYQKAIWWTFLFWPFGLLIYFYDVLRKR